MRADNSSAQAAFAKAADYLERRPLVSNHRPLSWITQKVCQIVEEPAPKWWWILTIVFGAMATLTPAMLTYLVSTGVGVWGLNV
ncbi:MAG: hydrogenase, partial [Verrucomicrobia bacterium]|nr:hydrogenase [Verrucomicrobiota bacterium]